MNVVPRILCRCSSQQFNTVKCSISFTQKLEKKKKIQPNTIWSWLLDKHRTSNLSQQPTDSHDATEEEVVMVPRDYKYVFPDFLPNTEFRDRIKELLERKDMYRRRSVMDIPEFYVGSILAVTVADTHSPSKTTRFVGICIQRENDGLRSTFTLRNHIAENGVEIRYEMYCPLLQNVEVLKLEKRLDDELLYLRDCSPEYSTIPFNMEPVFLPKGSAVPLNTIKVPLGPKPWEKKWHRQDLKGVQQPIKAYISKKEAKKIAMNHRPWEKYDLMKQYRENVNEDETDDVMKEVLVNKKKIDKAQYKKKLKEFTSG